MATPDTVNRTSLANWLKYLYFKRIVSQYYNSFPVWSRIEKRVDKEDFAGLKAIIPAYVGWSESVGAISEGGALPGAYYPQTAQMQVDVAYNVGRMRLTRPAMKASRSDAGSWARFLGAQMKDISENLKWDKARQMTHGDGTGILCTVTTGATSATMTVTQTGGECFIRTGMVIDVWTTGGSQEVDSIRVSNVVRASATTHTVTLASSQTFTTGSYVYREDSRNKECMGLAGIVDDGTLVATFQNLLRSTYPWLKCNVLSNGGTPRAVTLTLLDEAYMYGDETGGGGYPTAIYSNHVLARKYADILRADRRYGAEDMQLDGGWTAVKYSGVGGTCPWLMDRMIRTGKIYFVHEPDLLYFILSPLQWVEEDGQMLKWVSGYDAFDGYMAEYSQLAATRCNRHTLLSDMATT